jgi:hypothetical protein
MESFINVSHTHTHNYFYTSEDEGMSGDKMNILEDALNLLGVIAIFAFSVLLVKSLDTKQDLKDENEISPRSEPPEQQLKKIKKE